jgi:nitrogen regulatory protein PII-like uncharacterized protein
MKYRIYSYSILSPADWAGLKLEEIEMCMKNETLLINLSSDAAVGAF